MRRINLRTAYELATAIGSVRQTGQVWPYIPGHQDAVVELAIAVCATGSRPWHQRLGDKDRWTGMNRW